MREASEGGCTLGVVGVVLVTSGAMNAGLAATVDTCTGGSADSLRMVWLTLPLYALGFAALAVARPPRTWLILLLPAIALAAWHSIFAARFAMGFWQNGIAECDAFQGNFTTAYWEQSGGEPGLITGWVIASLLFWGGLTLLLSRSVRPPPLD